jgi:GNAT superfamily N-acetyltransferase
VGARRLYCRIREDQPESLAFAEKRGFRPTGRVERESRLKVDEARLDGFNGVEAQLRQEGISISTLAEIGMENDRFLRALHHMSEGTIQDVPHSEAFQPRPFEFWLERTLRFPGNSPEWCWVAVHADRPVGLARLRRQGNAAFNAYTAVDQAYRGRGIARALKLRTVLWARHNGVDFIYTGNDVENRRMLDINVRLGYEPLPGSIEVIKELS